MRLNFLSRRFNNFRYFVWAIMIIFFINQPAFGGKLQDFEQDVIEEREKEEPQIKYDEEEEEEEEEDDDNGFWGEIAQLMVKGIITGGMLSWERVHPGQSKFKFIQHRELGEALLPFARIDVGYQNVESDVGAFDSRAELGYGPFGLQARLTHYDEDEPSDELEIVQIHGLYRMSFGNHVEFDLGFGSSILNGENRKSGFSFTTPILIHPKEFVGIEFRPSWSTINGNPLDDYELGLVLSRSHAALRLGYRWMRSEHESLDGPYFGFSFKF